MEWDVATSWQLRGQRSAVVDERFVSKIGDKTAILRKYDMLTKILFCRRNNILFEKERIHLKNKI